MSDLQSFLHDLFSALRQAGRSGDGGREHEHWHWRAPAASTAPATTTTPSTTTTTPSTTAAASTTAPSATASSTTTTTPSTTAAATAAGSAASGTAAANPGIGAYGQRGIIAELNALVQDLSGTNSASGVSPRVLSNLNSAFEKLLSDLRGTASAASTASASSTSSSSSTASASSTSSASSASTAAGAASSSAAGTSDQSTAALQTFLTNFAQDLRDNGAHWFSPLGSSVNITA